MKLFLKLNSNKKFKYLKWRNKLSFQECIKLVTDWYKIHMKKNIYNFSINQIKYFEDK